MWIGDKFEKYEDEYCEFERIPENERLLPSKKLCGFLKIYSLLQSPPYFPMQGEHDMIWLANLSELKSVDTITDEDVIYLLRCGILLDAGNECLYCNT